MIKIVYIVVIGISLFSCRYSKKVQTVAVANDTTTVVVKPQDAISEDTAAIIKSTYEEFQKNMVDVTTFSAKVDVKYKDPEGKKYDVNANVRMYEDSIIWVSVTGLLGIEGLRACITSDSIKLIDKQNKTYSPRSVAYLQEITGLPLTLSSLQDLLLGNPVFFSSNISSFTRTDETISLLSEGQVFKNLLTINKKSNQLLNSRLDEIVELEDRSCLLSYNDYENKKGVNFSINRIINIEGSKNINIELEFKQYNFNETLSFPFNVPKNYKHN